MSWEFLDSSGNRKLVYVSATLVSILPASPVNGQEVYYQPSVLAAAGIIWHFRYNAASALSTKWELLGGVDYMTGPTAGLPATTSTTFIVPVGTASFTVPAGGVYKIAYGGHLTNNTSGTYNYITPMVNGVAVSTAADSYFFSNVVGQFDGTLHFEYPVTVATNDVITVGIRCTGGTMTADSLYLRAYPHRLT